jgi:hypothetical protein
MISASESCMSVLEPEHTWFRTLEILNQHVEANSPPIQQRYESPRVIPRFRALASPRHYLYWPYKPALSLIPGSRQLSSDGTIGLPRRLFRLPDISR